MLGSHFESRVRGYGWGVGEWRCDGEWEMRWSRGVSTQNPSLAFARTRRLATLADARSTHYL